MPALPGSLPRSLPRFLVGSAASLVMTTGLTAGLGFVFWAASSRLFRTGEVGQAATAVSAMNLLSTFAMLGLGTLLTARLPAVEPGHRGPLVTAATGVSALAGAVLAGAVGLLLPQSFIGLPDLRHAPWTALLFVAGVGVNTAGLVLDQALLSLLGGRPQLGRNIVLTVGKLIFLVALALATSDGGAAAVFASWLLGNLVSIAALAVWVWWRRRGRPATSERASLRPDVRLLRGLGRDAVGHHALNLALAVPYFSLPIVASVTLGSVSAGHMYALWQVASFVFMLPLALSTALFASGSRGETSFHDEFRFTLRMSVAACVAADLVVLVAGGWVLHLFGSDYAEQGRWALVLVSVAGLGVLVKDHHVSIARVTGRVARESWLIWGFSVVELAGASVGALLGGLTGLAVGWLAAVALEALVLGVRVLSVYRGGPLGGAASASAADADLAGSSSIPG